MKIDSNAKLAYGNLTDTLPKKFKPIAKFIEKTDSGENFANLRFAQDTITNWVPKAIFARSAADFGDVTFLEFAENFLVYYAGGFLSKNIFKKVIEKTLPQNLFNKIETPATELFKNKSSLQSKKLMPAKAAIAVCGMIIPITEYALSYAKNLFTMKIFKQADFNNIANLNDDKTEDSAKQKEVKESAKKHIKIAGGVFAGCLGFATLLATKGKNSKILQSISEAILIPGTKLFKNKDKAATFNNYFGFDDNLRGPLTACVLAGFFGYTGAAKDRGKQNLLEVLFRYPLVGFYVITGSSMFEKGFKSILHKKGGYEDLVGKDKNFKTPTLKELSALAQEIADKNKGTTAKVEFERLFKQKALIVGAPLLFSLGFMGLFVAGMSRFFTQYRYKKEQSEKSQNIPFGQNEVINFKNKIISA